VHHAGGLSLSGASALARPLPVSPGTSVMNALPPLFLLSSLLLAGCTIGPDYQRPATPQATHYQAMPGWKTATPADISGAGHWWQGYADAELDRLLTQLETDNLRLASAEAQYRQARALAGGARAGLFP